MIRNAILAVVLLLSFVGVACDCDACHPTAPTSPTPTPTPTPAECMYKITVAFPNVNARSNNGGFSVATQSGCSWRARYGVGWLHSDPNLGPDSGIGPGSGFFRIDTNASGLVRSGEISIIDVPTGRIGAVTIIIQAAS